MNENTIVSLDSNMTIQYVDDILVGGKSYYKHYVKANNKQKNLYLNVRLNNDSPQKDEVYKYILKNIDNESDDLFFDLDTGNGDSNTTSNAKTDGGGGRTGGSDKSSNKSGNQNQMPKLSENWVEYIDNAMSSIRNASNCGLSVIENYFDKDSSISGKYKDLDDSMAENKCLYKNMLNFGKQGYDNISNMVANYESTFNGIGLMIAKMFKDAQIKNIENDELNMMDDGSKEYFGTEKFNSEYSDILNNSISELEKPNSTFLFKDMFRDIGELQSKYSLPSLSQNESIFKLISDSSERFVDSDMKEQIDVLVKYMAGILGISELEARKAIKENPLEMAKQLYGVQMSVAEDVKNGGSGYEAPDITTAFWEFKDAFYSTDAGKEALLNSFITADSDEEGALPKNITPYDEKNSIAYTNYITYCMQIGKLNWLVDSCKEFPVVIDKINKNEIFDNPTKEVTDENTLNYLNDTFNDNNIYAFGYVKKDGKWYEVEYTERGQDMLYYMDYHCGENSCNSGDDRVITAFSNQGRIDAVGRNYKNVWINSHLGSNIDKNSVEYKNTERDYYILNGVIEDKKRYNELVENGELSFQDLANFATKLAGNADNLTDINYINKNKDKIMEELNINEKQLYNFSISLSSDSFLEKSLECAIVPFATAVVTCMQLAGGVVKFGENVVDAVNTALHSDFILGSTIAGPPRANNLDRDIIFDLTEDFKEFRDSTWTKYFDGEYYDKEFETFKNSVDGIKELNDYFYYRYRNTPATYYTIDGKMYMTVDDIPNDIKEEAFAKLFKDKKLKEWDLHDSSSSNYYLASFKEGIRQGGDFSRFDSLNEKVLENAKIQFNVQDEVKIDKTFDVMGYDTEAYKNLEAHSFVKKDNILGMVVNQIGNMAVPIGLSMIPGLGGTSIASLAQVFKGLSSAALFTSAFGGAAEEAFISGGSYNEALKYATFSATTELAIEHVFSGIGGYGEGWFDDIVEAPFNKLYSAVPTLENSLSAQTIKTLITGGIGEAAEEVLTDFVTPMWQSISYMNDKSYGEIFSENVSAESLLQTALVSFLSSMVFKGVEIKQQTSSFNKNLTSLQNKINAISDINLDKTTLEAGAKKVLAQYIGGIIENEGVIPSGLLEQLIKTTSNELLNANPEYAQELGKLQEQLKAFSNQKITIGEGKNSVSITGAELLKLEDFTGFDGKYTIEDGKIKFENEETQNKFNNKVFEMAQNQTDGYNSKLSDLVSKLKKAKDSLIIDDREENRGLIDKISNIVFKDDKVSIGEIETAIGIISELGNITNTSETVLLEHNGSIIQIPKAILSKVTTKLSIEEGKIKFNKDMNSGKFIQKLYDKAIALCNEKISKNSYDIDKIVNKGLINKAIDEIKPSLGQSNSSITVMNSTKVSENNLTKYDIKFDFLGISKNVSVYIEGNTDETAYKQVDKVKELIQTAILFSGNSSNIYLGQLVYDAKTKEMDIIQDDANALYVESLEYEASKTSGNIGQLQNVINSLTKINSNLEVLEIVTIQKDGKDVLIPKSLLEEITNKYKIVDGKVKFTKSMSVEKFISAVYDKAINLNNQKILGIKNTNIKNSTYVNTDGMYLYQLEVETIIDGETRTVNVYVDGNTDISSFKDSTKISQMLYQLLYENKNSNNIYVGQIVYDEKTGKINISENTANKLYVAGLNKTSESNSKVDVAVNEETTKSEEKVSDNAKSGEIEKGES